MKALDKAKVDEEVTVSKKSQSLNPFMYIFLLIDRVLITHYYIIS